MRTSLLIAAALVVLVVVAGVIYVAGPQPQSPSQTSSTTATSSSPIATPSSSSSISTVSSRLSSSSSSITTTSLASSATSSSASSSSSGSSASSLAGNWTTYHRDNLRSGNGPVANFTSVVRGWTSSVDGAVYAEPLVYGGDVFIATENNSVYALDAQSGSVVWRTNLGPPVDGSTLPCGDINPTGITATPVIDPTSGTIFVVSYSAYHHVLWALKTSDGAVVFQRSAVPQGFNEMAQQERAALSLANAMVYIMYGGLAGDCAQYKGWVIGLPESGTGTMVVYQVPASREAGIWTPPGASVDSSGNIYIATGNGASDTTFDYGNSVIRLSPTLSVEGYWAPTNWAALSRSDTDTGSTGPEFVGPNTIFQIGKDGVGYLLNASRLGGIGGATFSGNVCGSAFGGTAFSSPYILVPCNNGLVELKLAGSSFTTSWRSPSFFAGPPVVTGGVVWTVDRESASLLGYSLSSGRQVYSFQLGTVVHFCSLAAGNGRIFVAGGSQVVSLVLR